MLLRHASLVFAFVVFVPAIAEAHHDHHFSSSHHSSGGGCGGTHESSSEPSSPSTPSPTPTPSVTTTSKRVFVTSQTFSGALGGTAAADSFCQSAAAAHGMSGQWVAWLSDSNADAFDRVNDVSPWVTTNGRVAFATKDSLRAAPASDLLDENGAVLSAATEAWTGSDESGARGGDDCNDWTDATASATSAAGSALGGDPAWGGGDSPLRCDDVAPLICFEQ